MRLIKRVMHIQPTEDIIKLIQKTIILDFEIEHLCTAKVWEEWKTQELVSLRSDDIMNDMFRGLIPRDKSLDVVIDELVDDPVVRDTILSFEPKKLKKKKMVEYLRDHHEEEKEVFIGFTRTIEEIERYFVKSPIERETTGKADAHNS